DQPQREAADEDALENDAENAAGDFIVADRERREVVRRKRNDGRRSVGSAPARIESICRAEMRENQPRGQTQHQRQLARRRRRAAMSQPGANGTARNQKDAESENLMRRAEQRVDALFDSEETMPE